MRHYAARAETVPSTVLRRHHRAHAFQCPFGVLLGHSGQVWHLIDLFAGADCQRQHCVFHHHTACGYILSKYHIFSKSRGVDRSCLGHLQPSLIQPGLGIIHTGVDHIRHARHSLRELIYANSPLEADDSCRQQDDQRNNSHGRSRNADFGPKRPPHEVDPPNAAYAALYRLLGCQLTQKDFRSLRAVLYPDAHCIHQGILKALREIPIIAGWILQRVLAAALYLGAALKGILRSDPCDQLV